MKREAEWIRMKTGLIPDAYFSGPKIAWILDHKAAIRKAAELGELAFGTIDSWLIWNLTKERQHLTESSNASRTMLFNIHDLDWDKELLERMRIPFSMMPKVVPSNEQFGTTSGELLGFEAPILANLGDQQAALFWPSLFARRHGQVYLRHGQFFACQHWHKNTLYTRAAFHGGLAT